jgi:hypothetical protein
MESAYKLAIEIVANAKNFEVNINKAGGAVDDIVDKTREAAGENSEFAGSFGSVTEGIGKFMGIASAAVGTLAFIKSSIEAVEGPGDRFAEVIGGGKEAIFELQRAVATLDFSGFLQNLKSGFERGKEFTAMLDELADKSAYSDYIVAGLRAQSQELAETIKNKTLDISVRTRAAEDRNKIEEQIMKRTQDIATKTFLIEKKHWEDTNKMTTEEAIKIYEAIDAWSGDVQTKMAEAFKQAKEMSPRRTNLDLIARTVAKITDYNVGAINVYRDYLKLLETGEADVLPKLFTAYKNIDTVRADSQRTYNLSVRETSMLLNLEDKKVNNLRTSYQNLTLSVKVPNVKSLIAPEQPGLRPLKAATTFGSMDDLSKMNLAYKLIIMDIKLLQKLDNPILAISESFKVLNSKLSEGASSFKEYGKSVVNTVKNIIASLLAEAVASAVTAAIRDSCKTAYGWLLAPTIGALAAGLVKTAFNSLLPSFAGGAIAYGPTVAQIGEYPGARQDPEVVSPLSDLQRMINNRGFSGTVVFKIDGRTLVGVLEQESRVYANITGNY